jgi:acylphosphatase
MVATETTRRQITRRHCIFSGRVQGVGFRYATRNLSINFDVTGYVRNLPDGRVDLVIEGPAFEVDSFVDAINDRMKHYIRNIETHEQPAAGEFSQFIIAR